MAARVAALAWRGAAMAVRGALSACAVVLLLGAACVREPAPTPQRPARCDRVLAYGFGPFFLDSERVAWWESRDQDWLRVVRVEALDAQPQRLRPPLWGKVGANHWVGRTGGLVHEWPRERAWASLDADGWHVRVLAVPRWASWADFCEAQDATAVLGAPPGILGAAPFLILADGTLRPLAPAPKLSRPLIPSASLLWSPDGAWLGFCVTLPGWYAGEPDHPHQPPPWGVPGAVRADGTGWTELADITDALCVVPAPRGERAALLIGAELWVAEGWPGTARPTALLRIAGNVSPSRPAWSQDGSRLVYAVWTERDADSADEIRVHEVPVRGQTAGRRTARENAATRPRQGAPPR